MPAMRPSASNTVNGVIDPLACRSSRRAISAAMRSGGGTKVYHSRQSSPSRTASIRPGSCRGDSGSTRTCWPRSVTGRASSSAPGGDLLHWSEAKPRAGMRRRSDAAALRCAKGSLRCSISWPAENSLHSLRSLRSNSRGESEDERALRARGHESALLGAAYVAAGAPHPRLCRHHCARRRTPRAWLRGGRYPVGATCGAARSAAPRSARAARFVI